MAPKKLNINDLHASIFAFLDDLYIICTSVQMGQVMLNELAQELAKHGLFLHHKPCTCGADCECTCPWMCDIQTALCLSNERILLGGIEVRKVEIMNILGSIVTGDGNEGPAIEHRITQPWRCFHKWAHIFMSKASIWHKLQFWKKTVFRSMAWGIETLRSNDFLLGRLVTAQKTMVRKMLGLKRRPLMNSDGNPCGVELWLDYFKRSMSRAGTEISKGNACLHTLIFEERKRWASHLARMGIEGKPEHLCKGFVAWRCKSWWRSQQFYNELGWDVLKHQYPFKPSRWEDQFPADWLVHFSHCPG